MPWLFSTEDKAGVDSPWHGLIKSHLLRRTPAGEVLETFRETQEKSPIKSADLATVVIGFRSAYGRADDALYFRYVEVLLKSQLLEPTDLLLILLNFSPYGIDRAASPKKLQRNGMPTCEERLFTTILSADFPTSPRGILDLVFAVFRWLQVISEYETVKQLETSGLHTTDPFTAATYEALGTLAITVLSNKALNKVCKLRWWRERRSRMISEMERFDTHVLQWIQTPLAGRLRALIDTGPFVETDKKGRLKYTDRQILQTVPEIPIYHSRAGLFVWLNSALSGRPLIDDMTLLGYLQARHSGDIESLVVELLSASFDVLVNALLRKEPQSRVELARSFICNKIPLLLVILSSTIPAPATTESYIQIIFASSISMDPLPPITPGAVYIRDILKTTRLDFLQACALHGLTTEAGIATILQEPIALPRVTKYTKESLMAQFSTNSSRLEGYIGDLEGMQGNAGAIAACITQSLLNLCASKDTMALKAICNELVKQFPKMDIVMQYAQPGTFLPPLCTILNEWVHDQDQTECVPAYEEFASILLFILAMVNRYDLNRSDMGVLGDSFMAKLMESMTISKPMSELSPEQNSQLAKWIEGLFAIDENDDTNGISDEVMKNCSPQAFYLLVPTLFEQSLLACQSHALPIKAFRVGLELLLEPFLLPSIIMALGWLSDRSWEDNNDGDNIIQALEKLLRLTSTSQDTQAMHKTILSLTADPLTTLLQEVLRGKSTKPARKKVTDLLELLKPYTNRRLNVRCSKADIETWITSDQSIKGHVQRVTRDMISWATNVSHPPNPPPGYSQRELDTACQLLNGEQLLDAIVSQLMNTPSSSLPIALDVCTAMICSPLTLPTAGQSVSPFFKNTLKLRASVQLSASRLLDLSKKPHLEAETTIHLARNVTTQLAVVPIPPVVMPMDIPEQATDQIMQDLGLDLTADAAVMAADGTLDQAQDLAGLEQQLDLSNPSAQQLAAIAASDSAAMDIDSSQLFGDIGLEIDASQVDAQASGLGDPEEDIFAGLEVMDDFNFG